ncbi:hypothetical protein ACFC14_08545 [Microbacterium sp. NPDC055988]|uniref:hypothetical protein n=1 Tax=Microbacterium sp. NPDC055988 TaxID=3345671 RepID=UPI0035DCDFDC
MNGLWNQNDWSQLLEGDPGTLEVRSGALSRQATAINDAAQALQDIVSGQLSKSTTALRSTAAELQTSMSQAYLRYDETATALRTYAVTLAPIKEQAARDIPALEAAQGRLGTTEHAAGDAQRRQWFEGLSNSPQDVRQDTADDLSRAERQASAAQSDINAIVARLRAGAQSKEDAAQAAIRAIESVISQGKDSVLDNIAQFFEGVGDLLASIGRWVTDVIKGVLDTLSDIWNALLPKIMAVLLLALIPIVLGLAGLLLGGPLFGAVLALLGGAVALTIGGVLITRILTDVLAPDPEVTPFEINERDNPMPSRADYATDAEYQAALEAWKAQTSTIGSPSLENAFAEAGLVDWLGGTSPADEQGVIRVEQVVGADGVTRWRVVLPSTQDWVMSLDGINDAGATNDLDSNLALMLTPELQTQYERAVMQAMQDAGIDPGPNGDPVMLVGFSQGGIMAGHLAANRSSAYNFEAVMACGSPIDAMRIPPTTQVISMQHQGDPVPMLDTLTNGAVNPRQEENWRTFTPVAPGHQPAAIDAGAHNAALYNLSWQEQLANLPADERARLEQFYAHDGATVATEEYAWSE